MHPIASAYVFTQCIINGFFFVGIFFIIKILRSKKAFSLKEHVCPNDLLKEKIAITQIKTQYQDFESKAQMTLQKLYGICKKAEESIETYKMTAQRELVKEISIEEREMDEFLENNALKVSTPKKEDKREQARLDLKKIFGSVEV